MEILSKRIRDLRDDADLKQSEMAEKLGITQNMVSYYENGRDVPPAVIVGYAKYFDVSTDYLLGRSHERKPSTDTIAENFDLLSRLSSNPLFTGTNIATLTDAAIRYYQAGAPADDSPIICITSFLSAMEKVLLAAAASSTGELLEAINEAASAILSTNEIVQKFIDSKKGI